MMETRERVRSGWGGKARLRRDGGCGRDARRRRSQEGRYGPGAAEARPRSEAGVRYVRVVCVELRAVARVFVVTVSLPAPISVTFRAMSGCWPSPLVVVAVILRAVVSIVTRAHALIARPRVALMALSE